MNETSMAITIFVGVGLIAWVVVSLAVIESKLNKIMRHFGMKEPP